MPGVVQANHRHASCPAHRLEPVRAPGADRPPERVHGHQAALLDPARVLGAVQLCSTCPVTEHFRAAGDDEPDGIWGGIPRSPAMRRALKEALAAEAQSVSGAP